MDPDANLKELRALIKELESPAMKGLTLQEVIDKGQRALELTGSLDGWLSSGGFLPKAWGKR